MELCQKVNLLLNYTLIEKAFEVVVMKKLEIITPIVFYTDDSDAYFETKN